MRRRAHGQVKGVPVCGHEQSHARSSMLNARRATFFSVDWANKEARERA
jgi:hypothetical protein